MRASDAQVLWLVRHGQRQDTDPTWRPKLCHHTEVPLSALGHAQADALGRRLASASIDHLFCSPFLRAVQTAAAIARHSGLAIKIEHGAMEWLDRDGIRQPPPLLTTAELASEFSQVDTSYVSRIEPVWPETREQVHERLARTVACLIGEFSGRILVVGHGITVTGMASALLDPPYPIEDALCGIVRLGRDRQGAWRLRINGDTDHLTGELASSLH